MSKHVGENCGKLCICSILNYKRSKPPTKIDDTRPSSEVHQIKLIWKTYAQYVKACRRNVRKICFPVFLVQKWA